MKNSPSMQCSLNFVSWNIHPLIFIFLLYIGIYLSSVNVFRFPAKRPSYVGCCRCVASVRKVEIWLLEILCNSMLESGKRIWAGAATVDMTGNRVQNVDLRQSGPKRRSDAGCCERGWVIEVWGDYGWIGWWLFGERWVVGWYVEENEETLCDLQGCVCLLAELVRNRRESLKKFW